MNREVQMIRDYLGRQMSKHLQQCFTIAAGSLQPADHGAIVDQAKSARVYKTILEDLKLLEQDEGEFILRFLS